MADKPEQTPDNGPEKKRFSLKPNESELLRGEFQRHNISLASMLSFIAVERLAFPVDPQTAFTLEDDLKTLVVWQQPVEEPPAPVDLGAGQATDTAKALKETK